VARPIPRALAAPEITAVLSVSNNINSSLSVLGAIYHRAPFTDKREIPFK
jgi:hypothetical protein